MTRHRLFLWVCVRFCACFCLTTVACRGNKTGTDRAAATVQTLIAAGRQSAHFSDADDAWAATELGRMAARVRAERQRDPNISAAAAMNRTVFDVLAFERQVDDTDLRFVLLPQVLRQHRGSCVGQGLLYLALAALLDVPAAGVIVPGHFFVRVDEAGRWRNVELLRRGEAMPDDWYRQRYPIAGGGSPAYARALSIDEVAAVVDYNVGQQWRQKARLPDARVAYQQATTAFPGFPEAQASLGATLHLLGELDLAAAAYTAARQAYPELPGLTNNIMLLERERQAAKKPGGTPAPVSGGPADDAARR